MSSLKIFLLFSSLSLILIGLTGLVYPELFYSTAQQNELFIKDSDFLKQVKSEDKIMRKFSLSMAFLGVATIFFMLGVKQLQKRLRRN